MIKPGIILELLEAVKVDAADKVRLIRDFQDIIWGEEQIETSEEVTDLLAALAYDLDFFVADPTARKETISYYGHVRAEHEITEALNAIRKTLDDERRPK